MKLGSQFGGRWLGLVVLACAVACLSLAGCGSGSDGQDGAPGAPGSDTGTLTGTVMNAMAGTPMQGVTVTLAPTGATTSTGAAGTYSFNDISIGAYTVSVSPSGFAAQSTDTGVVADGTTTVDFDLMPNAPVAVSIAITGDPTPEGTVSATVNVTTYDGSTPSGYEWSQFGPIPASTAGGGWQVPVAFDTTTAQTTTITFGTAAEYKDALRSWVHTPERWDVLPINPYSLEEGDAAQIQCKVTTSSGVYTATTTLHVELDFAAWASGILNVPVGVPVLMNGKTQATYDWALVPPTGSAATLNDDMSINPWFVPDIAGTYTLTVTDDAEDVWTIEVHAGNWRGVITDQLPSGLPQPDTLCTGCHQPGGLANGNQFAEWQVSGHAEIFTTNVNFSTHYSTSCFPCHTVGYNTDPAAVNDGFDDTTDYQDFLDEVFPGGHHHPDAGNWTWMLDNTPATAQRGNIQCENCHGPQNDGGAHMNSDARVSMRSDVCGFCHGEPPRHGRFQQWQLSGHGNYELAMDESGGSCADCHTAQGFLGYWDGSGASPAGPDDAHPQTCAVCHKTHNVGTVSGQGTDAKLRVMDALPSSPDEATYKHNVYNQAGFEIRHAGEGAMCMSCHNGRRGQRNDYLVWSEVGDKDREPHQGPQADMLYGQNAYFVQVGVPGAHAFLEDTCVTCHLQLTPPPEDYAYAGGGTNHSFKATLEVCSDCHGEFNGGSLQDQVADGLDDLGMEVARAIEDEIAALIGLGYTVDVSGTDINEVDLPTVTIGSASTFSVDHVGGSHGRCAFDITVDGTTYYHVQMGGDTSISAGGNLIDNTYFENVDGYGQPEILVKAAYNLNLIHLDKSEGVHNPSFVIDIFVATFEKLDALTWASAGV